MSPDRLAEIWDRHNAFPITDGAGEDIGALLDEVDRLRGGIQELRTATHLGARTNANPEARHVLQMVDDDLRDLLEPVNTDD